MVSLRIIMDQLYDINLAKDFYGNHAFKLDSTIDIMLDHVSRAIYEYLEK